MDIVALPQYLYSMTELPHHLNETHPKIPQKLELEYPAGR